MSPFRTQRFPGWWEHPVWIAANEREEPWDFDPEPEARKLLTVYPRGVVEFKIKHCNYIYEWDFVTEHPHLLPYEQRLTVICNAPITSEEWRSIESVSSRLPGHLREANLSEYCSESRVRQLGHNSSFALGAFPRPIYLELRLVLEECGIPFLPLTSLLKGTNS